MIDYYGTYGKVPTIRDLDKSGYPTGSTFMRYFGSYTNALEYADLQTRKYTRLNNQPNVCELCGVSVTPCWYEKNGLKVCFNCYRFDRNHMHGVLNPDCTVGIAVITEYVTYVVIGDCIKCNTRNNFNFPYDLISEKYGTINVKSSILRSASNWSFTIHESSREPDYYICIGFNEDKTKILKVFRISGHDDNISKYGISITNTDRGLKKWNQYEIDHTPFNKVYQNLDIYTLSEFRNYNK